MAFISWEQGNKGQILRGTGEPRQYSGTGNIRKQIFDFWGTGEQVNLFQGNKGTGTPPPLGGPHPWKATKRRVQAIIYTCACKHIYCLFVCLFCCFMSQVNSYGHGGTVSSPNHTFLLGKLEQTVNQYFAYILSLATFNNPS